MFECPVRADARRSMDLQRRLSNDREQAHRQEKARTVLVTVAISIGASALAAPTASAGLLVESAPSCTGPGPRAALRAVRRPGSVHAHAAAGPSRTAPPAGSSPRATVESGSNPYQVNGGGHTKALRIAPGGVATSPDDLRRPRAPHHALLPEELWRPAVALHHERRGDRRGPHVGLVVPVPIGVVLPSTQWHPSAVHVVVANLLPLLPETTRRWRSASGPSAGPHGRSTTSTSIPCGAARRTAPPRAPRPPRAAPHPCRVP